jgi:hypothetical protein
MCHAMKAGPGKICIPVYQTGCSAYYFTLNLTFRKNVWRLPSELHLKLKESCSLSWYLTRPQCSRLSQSVIVEGMALKAVSLRHVLLEHALSREYDPSILLLVSRAVLYNI